MQVKKKSPKESQNIKELRSILKPIRGHMINKHENVAIIRLYFVTRDSVGTLVN